MGGTDNIKMLPECDRPYEKMMAVGPEAMSDSELLSIIIRSGTKKKNAISCAQNLLIAFDGKLENVIGASIAELQKIEGIGTTKAVQLKAINEIALRANANMKAERADASDPRVIGKILIDSIGKKRQEVFRVVALDKKLKVLKATDIAVGTLDRTIVHPREVFEVAIRELAYAIIVSHNHPSGDVTPSREDIMLTSRLKEAGNIMGIPLLDHIIVGRDDFYSMHQNGDL